MARLRVSPPRAERDRTPGVVVEEPAVADDGLAGVREPAAAAGPIVTVPAADTGPVKADVTNPVPDTRPSVQVIGVCGELPSIPSESGRIVGRVLS